MACRKWRGVSGSSLGAAHPVIWEVDVGPLSPPGWPGLSSRVSEDQTAPEQVTAVLRAAIRRALGRMGEQQERPDSQTASEGGRGPIQETGTGGGDRM